MPGGEAKAANIQTFYQLAADFESGNLKDLGQFWISWTPWRKKD